MLAPAVNTLTSGSPQERQRPSVVLPDVPERLLKHVVVADLELDVQRRPERLADLLVATDRGLPALETDGLHDLVNPVDDVFDNHGGLVGLERLEQLGEGGLALLLAGHRVDSLLGGD